MLFPNARCAGPAPGCSTLPPAKLALCDAKAGGERLLMLPDELLPCRSGANGQSAEPELCSPKRPTAGSKLRLVGATFPWPRPLRAAGD